MNKHIAHEMQIALCSTQSNKFYNVLIYISNYMIQLNSEYSDTFLDNDSDLCVGFIHIFHKTFDSTKYYSSYSL